MGYQMLGKDGIIWKGVKYCEWIKFISYINIFKHNIGLIKKIFIQKAKRDKYFQNIPMIVDKLIQMLFVITYGCPLEYIQNYI